MKSVIETDVDVKTITTRDGYISSISFVPKGKILKSFAIYDHGVLHPSQFKCCSQGDYRYTGVFTGRTTKKAIGTALQRIEELGYDPAIIIPALKAIPKQDVKKGSYHYITVRWS